MTQDWSARYAALVGGDRSALEAPLPTGDWHAPFALERTLRLGAEVPVGEPASPLARARWAESALRVAIASQAPMPAPEESVDERSVLVAELSRAWAAWYRGTSVDAEALSRQAAALRLPSLAIEAMSLRALLSLQRGELDEALRRARQASRMGRADGIPFAEILANLVLARVRRHVGQPYRALRILAALERYAPPIWRSWLGWEALMAGQWSGPSSFLRDAVHSAGAGEPTQVHEGFRNLALESRSVAHQQDAAGARALLLSEASETLIPWQQGHVHDLPAELRGLSFASSSATGVELHAWVAVGPEGARRIPHAAAGLARADGFVSQTLAAKPRVDAGLALLALASAPIDKPSYFKELYGFTFEPPLHRAMLSVHLGRVRTRLGSRGELVSEEGQLQVRFRERALLPDPRCVEPLPARTLRMLAKHSRGLAAKTLASQLHIPLRTAQRALRELVEEGSLVSQSEGRAVTYLLEDTTFSEPTMSRVFPPDGLTP